MTQDQALTILKTGSNVFLTGEPGSGKTHLINEYVSYLREHEIEPAITASTGIAATHIGGMTIHSWGGIGIKTELDKQDLSTIATNEYVAKRVRRTHVLIIDEVSMLSPGTLSLVDMVCRTIRESAEPFGGLQVVFVGDFFQLPPVVKKDTIQNAQATFMEDQFGRFAYDCVAWTGARSVVCYLTEQYRQDDMDFLTVLSAIRGNAFADVHLSHIEKRKTLDHAAPLHAPKLYAHNVDVDRVNDDMIHKLEGKPRTFLMESHGPRPLVEALMRGCLSPETLHLKTNAAVMFTKNNPRVGFVNGTLGVVEGFEKESGYPIVLTRGQRRIHVEPMEWTVEEHGKVRAQVIQLPLRLAWAITVHKSQGMSLDEAVMDLTDVFEYGQGYVALSRVRRLSGLHLLGWNERAFQVHPDILEKDASFRAAAREAEARVAEISVPDLEKKYRDFIIRCGGKIQAAKIKKEKISERKKKESTFVQTLTLWNEGKNIAEIAKTRGLVARTIMGHVEELAGKGLISRDDLSRLLTPRLSEKLGEIQATFHELDTDRLSPVFEALSGEYSYEELQIARMMLGK